MTPRPALLRDHDFLRLWLLGGIVEGVRWLEILAVSVFALQLTGSALVVAMLGFVRVLPMILLGNINGTLAERFDRRALMLAYLALMMASVAILSLLAVSDELEVWHVGVGAFLNGAFYSSDFPLRRTMLSVVAGTDRTSHAVSLDISARSAMRGVGPLVGGIVLETIDIVGVFLIGLGLYVVGFLAILTLRHRGTAPPTMTTSLLQNAVDGIRYVRRVPILVGVLCGTVVMNMLVFSYVYMIPVMAVGELGLSPSVTGMLQSAEGFGAAIGAAGLALFTRHRHFGFIFMLGSVGVCFSVIAFAFSTWVAASVVLLFLAGVGLACFATMQNTLMLVTSDPAMRSRAMGALAVGVGTGPFGILQIGFLADEFGVRAATAIVAIESLIGLALMAIFIAPLRRPLTPPTYEGPSR
ncbi:MAG: MFS transporter [Alphaproteobacteria bacterium]|nr:MFS transporter [Alphaproteobacteria bacterium]